MLNTYRSAARRRRRRGRAFCTVSVCTAVDPSYTDVLTHASDSSTVQARLSASTAPFPPPSRRLNTVRSLRFTSSPLGADALPTVIDAQDMHDLRTRSLVFVHNLVEALRSRNVSLIANRPSLSHLVPDWATRRYLLPTASSHRAARYASSAPYRPTSMGARSKRRRCRQWKMLTYS